MTKDPVLTKLISENLKNDMDLALKLRQMPEYRVHASFHTFVDTLYYSALKFAEEYKV